MIKINDALTKQDDNNTTSNLFLSPKDIFRSTLNMTSVRQLNAENLDDRLERYIRYFTISTERLKGMVKSFQDEISLGLKMFSANPYAWDPHKCSFKMLDACLSKMPSGNEEGVYYALDFGGTNFRVVRADLKGDGQIKTQQQSVSLSAASNSHRLPKGLLDPCATATQMFDFFASVCQQLMLRSKDINQIKNHRINQKKHFETKGHTDNSDHPPFRQSKIHACFTFSFPCRQQKVDSAILLEWTKGFATGRKTVDPVEGVDIAKLMQAGLERNCIPLVINSIINDTVGTLLSCAYTMDHKLHPTCRIGLILGTGVNACYYEKNAPRYGYQGNVINLECGNYNRDLPLTNVDNELDFAEVTNIGRQRFEKMIAGAYLGELARRTIVKVFQHLAPCKAWVPYSLESKDVSTIVGDESEDLKVTANTIQRVWSATFEYNQLRVVKRICTIILDRSAALASVIIAGISCKTEYLQQSVGGLTVGIDGSLYREVSYYRQRLRCHLYEILGHDYADLIHILIADDGSGKGGAILAATLDS